MQNKIETGKTFVRRYCADISGATAVEYGLLVGVLTVGLIASYKVISVNENSLWNSVSNSVEATGNGAP